MNIDEQIKLTRDTLNPPKPRKVPLTLADVPPGSEFIAAPEKGRVLVHVNIYGIEFRCDKKDYSYTWHQLQDEQFYIHRPGQDWKLCEKDAE